jgi:ribonucleotide reductase alpha subunit
MTSNPATKKVKLTSVFNPVGPPPFNTVGLFTYLRTYARRHNDNNPNSTIESWEECLTRVVLASNSQLNVGFTEDELKELFSLLYNLKCSVAGRFLWQLGSSNIDKTGLMSLQNCAFTSVNDPVIPFTWVMNFLMLGAGCGYSVMPEHLNKLPPVNYALVTRKETNDADFIVPDSREGWIKLLGRTMKAHFYSGKGFNYSCILLRSKGAPIKGFGGVSSGPEVLCNGIQKINQILNLRAGQKLRPIDALDIMNIIGQIVVSGNVRRSAQICLGDCNDIEYLRAKRWDLGNIPNYRCYSNNSVICNDINEILENEEFWQGYLGNGEPYGLINMKLSRSCGRLGETQYPDPDVIGYNPCVTGDTWVLTSTGSRQVKDLVGKGRIDVIVDGKSYPTTDKGFFETGNKDVYILKTIEGHEIKTTNDHKFLTKNNSWVELRNLTAGECLVMGNHSNLMDADVDNSSYKRGFSLGVSVASATVFPHKMEEGSVPYHKGFYKGFKLSCGNCYKCYNPEVLKTIQRMFARVGHHSMIRDDILYLSDEYDCTSRVSTITYLGKEDVYDCTVPSVSAFDANGFYIHNCAEQSLNDKETCCLAEIYLPNIKNKDELFKCATYMYRINKHSLTLPCPDSKETENVVYRNMRMGIGISGYLQATDEQKSWLSSCYEYLRDYDKKYSMRHGFPPSIKLTTVKPSGTLSLLAGVTSGVHPGYAQYYIRRIRVASDSSLIEIAKNHGYHCEYVRNFDQTIDPTTMVLSFPYSLPEHTVFADNCTAIQQLEFVKRLQTEWSDNSVSCTVYYRKEELSDIKEWLRINYNSGIKTVSFLLHSGHGFHQAPLEKITKEQYDEMTRNTRPITDVSGICYSKDDEKHIADQECAGGMCPIK